MKQFIVHSDSFDQIINADRFVVTDQPSCILVFYVGENTVAVYQYWSWVRELDTEQAVEDGDE